jgi:hypothetical protein
MRRKIDTPQPRAETIRSKRNEQKPQTRFNSDKIKQASQRSPVMARPITTRRSIPGIPTTKKTFQGKSKKRYYFSLQTLGAEIRLPAIPTIKVSWRLLSSLIVLAMAAGLMTIWNNPSFQVYSVKLIGARRLTSEELISGLALTGMRVVEIVPQQITNDLIIAFPDLSAVKVQVALPAKLTVTITERIPVIAWQQNDRLQWIDQQGYAFPPRGESEGIVLVQAQGDPPQPIPAIEETAVTATPSPNTTAAAAAKVVKPAGPFLDPELVSAIIALGPQVPPNTPVVYDPQYGLGWNDPEGWQVFIGKDISDIQIKLAQYRAIVEQVKQQGIQPLLISVEFPYAPFYRLEK